MDYLYKKLKDYASSDYYGFHMPGHKRSRDLTGAELPYDIDITEIEGFDDLHHAGGILKQAQNRAASVYRAEETHYLINGSTVGILSAVLGCTRRGERILMARNCHRSVYNAVLLNELEPVYIYPELLDGTELNAQLSPEKTALLLEENPDIKVTVITSPTYDGVVSDVRSIADLVHARGGILILDEAHGAHFGFHPDFPENGNVQGADVVIHSLHKTLPALTQTALLHMNGTRVDRKRVRRYLHMLQSSSPSYVLMAGIDECVRALEERHKDIFERYTQLLRQTRKRLSKLQNLKLVDTEHYDISKIVISAADCVMKKGKEIKKFTGKDLYNVLNEKYLLQMEMAAASYMIAMTSPADTEEGMDRLVSALTEIDGKLAKADRDEGNNAQTYKRTVQGATAAAPESRSEEWTENKQIYMPAQAVRLKEEARVRMENDRNAAGSRGGNTEYVSLSGCAGRVALEYAYIYPPGIPLTVPGERISEGTADQMQKYEAAGLQIEGTELRGEIEVLTNG